MSEKRPTEDPSKPPAKRPALEVSPRQGAAHTCTTCGEVFTLVVNLVRHERAMHGGEVFPCQSCGKIFKRRDNLIRHSKIHLADATARAAPPPQRVADSAMPPPTAVTTTDAPPPPSAAPSTSQSSSQCGGSSAMLVDADADAPPSARVQDPPPGFSSALNGSCQRWRSEGAENVDLLNYLRSQDHRRILEGALKDLKSVKFFVCVNVRFVRHDTYRGDGDREIFPYFTSHAVRLTESGDIDALLNQAYDELLERMQKFIREGSGWVLAGVEFCDLLIVKYRPMRGGSYIPLPKKIAYTRGVVNIQNEDNLCFLYSLLAHKFPAGANLHRVQHYKPHLNYFNVEGFEMPMPLKQISKFEKINNISINVFGYDEEDGVYPRHISESHFEDHVNLLLISDDWANHYCYIKDLNKL